MPSSKTIYCPFTFYISGPFLTLEIFYPFVFIRILSLTRPLKPFNFFYLLNNERLETYKSISATLNFGTEYACY